MNLFRHSRNRQGIQENGPETCARCSRRTTKASCPATIAMSSFSIDVNCTCQRSISPSRPNGSTPSPAGIGRDQADLTFAAYECQSSLTEMAWARAVSEESDSQA
jgi:hypothetical protein